MALLGSDAGGAEASTNKTANREHCEPERELSASIVGGSL
jgi:hypothetical protein